MRPLRLWIIGFFCLAAVELPAQSLADVFHRNPLEAFTQIAEHIDHSGDLSSCQSFLRTAAAQLRGAKLTRLDDRHWLDFSHTDPSQNPRVWLRELAQKSSALQQELRLKLAEAEKRNTLDEDLLSSVREMNRVLRFVRDYSLVYLRADPELLEVEDSPVFFSPSNQLESFDFKAGDIILTRGPTGISALIPRLPIQEQDGHFSHAILVAENADGEIVFIESLLESGVQILSMEDFKKRRPARGALLRHPDAELARTASEWMLQRVVEGPYIPYDFTGRGPSESSEAFQCVHVPQVAFHKAAEILGRDLKIPSFASWLDRSSPIVRQLGLDTESGRIFAPQDLWYQFDFDLVGEWVFVDQLANVLLFDASADALFRWSRNEGLQIHTPLSEKLAAKAKALVATFWDQMPDRIQQRLPRDMPAEEMAVAFVLYKLVNLLKTELDRASDDFRQNNDGIPFSWVEASEALDDIRRRLEENPRSPIHLLIPSPSAPN